MFKFDWEASPRPPNTSPRPFNTSPQPPPKEGELGVCDFGGDCVIASRELSRRDNTLLTVDFNLRHRRSNTTGKVPQGRYMLRKECRPCRTLLYSFTGCRRLKPTVNSVSSLQDFMAVGIL